MNNLLLKFAEILGLAYWIEIKTEIPKCIYYFGPFLTQAEAENHQSGYVEDLKGEGAINIQLDIKQTKPKQLTIFDEADETVNFKPIPVFNT
jgi:hypothetical protein